MSDSEDDATLALERTYVAAIEATLQQLRGRAALLSPADLERVLDWHRRDVPLALVLRVIETVGGRTRHAPRWSRPRTLAFFESAVEQAFSHHLAAQLGARRDPERPLPALPDLLREAAQAIGSSLAPAPARQRVQQALEAAALDGFALATAADPLADLERELLEACAATLDATQRSELEAAIAAELAPYADSMSEAALARAKQLGSARRLRLRFRLPDLSLLPLLGGPFPTAGG